MKTSFFFSGAVDVKIKQHCLCIRTGRQIINLVKISRSKLESPLEDVARTVPKSHAQDSNKPRFTTLILSHRGSLLPVNCVTKFRTWNSPFVRLIVPWNFYLNLNYATGRGLHNFRARLPVTRDPPAIKSRKTWLDFGHWNYGGK